MLCVFERECRVDAGTCRAEREKRPVEREMQASRRKTSEGEEERKKGVMQEGEDGRA